MSVEEFKKRIDDSWSRCVKESEIQIEKMNHHKVSADAIEEACAPIDTCISSFWYEIKQLEQTSFSPAEQTACKDFLNRKIIEANFKLADIYGGAVASGWKDASFLSITSYLQAIEISVQVSDDAQIVQDAGYVMKRLKRLPKTSERDEAIEKIDKIKLDMQRFIIVSVKQLKKEVRDVWNEHVEYSENCIKQLKLIQRNHGVNLRVNKDAILAFDDACDSIVEYINEQSESYLKFSGELSWSVDQQADFIRFLYREKIKALFKLANYYELGVSLALAKPSDVINTYLDAMKISASIPDADQIESDSAYVKERLYTLKKTKERDNAIAELDKIQADMIGLYLRKSVEDYLYTKRSSPCEIAFFPVAFFSLANQLKVSNITDVILRYLN
jgi:hypothetical protein